MSVSMVLNCTSCLLPYQHWSVLGWHVHFQGSSVRRRKHSEVLLNNVVLFVSEARLQR